MSVSSTSSTSGTLGNAPPVSFPGVSSGIDYNAIIQKYTEQTLAQNQPLINKVQGFNAANTAILKIKGLLGSVQDTLTALSDQKVFGAYKAAVGNTASGSPAATTKQNSLQAPIAGTYTINAQTAATATQIANNPSANAPLNAAVTLATAGTSVTPTNGTAANGQITVNGVAVSYDVNTQSLTTILNNIQAQVAGFTYTINPAGTVTLNGVTTLGSGGDSGNLLQVLKVDTAQLAAGTVTSSSPVNGINQTSTFTTNNNAGFAVAVTTGTFTINGVQFSVNAATDSLSNVINKINASNAGVTASYNTATSSITLTNKTPGPQSILLGSGLDTSNFLSASGLSTGTTTAGTQAQLQYTDNTGPHTVFSSNNDFSNVIPGFTLSVTTSSPGALPPGSTFYTVTVGADPSQAETAIKAFIKAYNAAIQELNKDTVAPQVTTSKSSTGTAQSQQTTTGGVLYNNFSISSLKNQLVQLVSGIVPNGSSSYNSLASIGLKLNTSSSTVGASDSSDSSDSDSSSSSNNNNGTFTVTGGTDGTLGDLDVTKFEAAYAANTGAVQALFTLTPPQAPAGVPPSQFAAQQQSGLAYQLGSYISGVDGLTTFLAHSVITPSNLNNLLLEQILETNQNQIDSTNKQIATIKKEATQQADSLRAQFSASESQIAQLQALQSQIAAIGH